uniref:Platelet activating factor acetylhydrolase 1b catalytic subunit 3 n=3 Tax=Homininae TaxID=207598 RepID=K7AKY8_PANTR
MTTSLEAVGTTGGSRMATGGSWWANGRRLPTRALLRSRLVFRRRTRPGFSGC